jgi:ankyrin repeat protein
LQNGADIHRKDNKWGSTALMMATHGGYAGCLEVLLQHGASANDRDEDKMLTALMAAALRGHEECLKLLLRNRANVNAKSKEGWTALMQASRTGHYNCVQILLTHEAKVDDIDEKGNTALMVASQNGHDACMKILLDAGSDVNLKRKDGSSALIMAANKSFEGCVQLLLEAGADADALDSKGYNALEKVCMNLLASQGKTTDSSTRSKQLSCAKMLRKNCHVSENCRFFMTSQHPHPLIAREDSDPKNWFCDGALFPGAPDDCKGKLDKEEACRALHKRNTCSTGCNFDLCECCGRAHYLRSMTFDEIIRDI